MANNRAFIEILEDRPLIPLPRNILEHLIVRHDNPQLQRNQQQQQDQQLPQQQHEGDQHDPQVVLTPERHQEQRRPPNQEQRNQPERIDVKLTMDAWTQTDKMPKLKKAWMLKIMRDMKKIIFDQDKLLLFTKGNGFPVSPLPRSGTIDDSIESGDSIELVWPTEHVEPVEPAEPTEYIDLVDPIESIGSDDPMVFQEPIEPIEIESVESNESLTPQDSNILDLSNFASGQVVPLSSRYILIYNDPRLGPGSAPRHAGCEPVPSVSHGTEAGFAPTSAHGPASAYSVEPTHESASIAAHESELGPTPASEPGLEATNGYDLRTRPVSGSSPAPAHEQAPRLVHSPDLAPGPSTRPATPMPAHRPSQESAPQSVLGSTNGHVPRPTPRSSPPPAHQQEPRPVYSPDAAPGPSTRPAHEPAPLTAHRPAPEPVFRAIYGSEPRPVSGSEPARQPTHRYELRPRRAHRSSLEPAHRQAPRPAPMPPHSPVPRPAHEWVHQSPSGSTYESEPGPSPRFVREPASNPVPRLYLDPTNLAGTVRSVINALRPNSSPEDSSPPRRLPPVARKHDHPVPILTTASTCRRLSFSSSKQFTGFKGKDRNITLIEPRVDLGPNRTRVPRKVFEEINWESPREAARQLLDVLFDRQIQANHATIESPSFRSLFEQINPLMIDDIVFCVAVLTEVEAEAVRKVINEKLAEESRIYDLNAQSSSKPSLRNRQLWKDPLTRYDDDSSD